MLRQLPGAVDHPGTFALGFSSPAGRREPPSCAERRCHRGEKPPRFMHLSSLKGDQFGLLGIDALRWGRPKRHTQPGGDLAGCQRGCRGHPKAEGAGGAQIPKRSELGGTNPKPGGTNPPRGSSPGPPLSRRPPGPQLSPQPPRAASPRSTRRGAGRGRPAAGRRRRG